MHFLPLSPKVLNRKKNRSPSFPFPTTMSFQYIFQVYLTSPKFCSFNFHSWFISINSFFLWVSSFWKKIMICHSFFLQKLTIWKAVTSNTFLTHCDVTVWHKRNSWSVLRRKIDRRNLRPINYREVFCSNDIAIYYCTFCSGYLLFVYSQLSQGQKYKLKVSPLCWWWLVSVLELRKIHKMSFSKRGHFLLGCSLGWLGC